MITDVLYGALSGFLLVTGSLAAAMALGLAVVHWAAGRPRPYLDRDGWLMGVYGTAALAVCDVLNGEAGPATVVWIVAAVTSAYRAGRPAARPAGVIE